MRLAIFKKPVRSYASTGFSFFTAKILNMSNWIYTNIQHQPRKALGISVLEYCVLDYIYKTQVHPDYNINGWANTGCHKIGEFLGISSGTVKGIFDRMSAIDLLDRMGKDLKRTTDKFYSIAYETDVQKLNTNRSETEHQTVQKLNTNRSETEHNNKIKKTIIKDNEDPKIKIELHDQIEETKVKVYEVIKSTRNKYIQPPTLEQIIPIFLEKLIEKRKLHPQILDSWNHANHQAEKFWLHWDEKNWKIQKLNGAIATWINQSISYGVVLKDCPVKYPGNPQQQKQAQVKHIAPMTQVSKEDLEQRRSIFDNAFNKLG